MNILLLVVLCLWCHAQPTAGESGYEDEMLKSEKENEKDKGEKHIGNEVPESEKENRKTAAAAQPPPTTTTATKASKCPKKWAHLCAGANRKRTDINGDLARETDIRVDGERPDIHVDLQEGRAQGRGRYRGRGGSRNDEYRDSREGDDDLRSDFNDLRRQLSDEVELVDIGNHRRGHSARSAQLDSAIDRLRSLLGTTDLDVDDREEKDEDDEEETQEVEEEPLKRNKIDTDRSYIINETQTLLSKILDDIERRLDSKPVSDSGSKK